MPIQVLLNDVDISSQIDFKSLTVTQNLTNAVDTAVFSFIKASGRSLPVFDDDIVVKDGASVIFAGIVAQVRKEISEQMVETVEVNCVDYTAEFDRVLAAKTYEDETIENIIADLVLEFAPAFTANNVESTFVISKIVFNQAPLSECLTKLANIVSFEWYIDENKDVHFFEKFSRSAPFDLTDENGKYIFNTLNISEDGSQIINRVKVRGGEYNGETFTDITTVKGSNTKSFKLPYRFANLTIELNTGAGFVAQDVGVDFIDDFSSKDVLYNYQEQMIRFENALSDGNQVRFSGNPKVPVLAIAEDAESMAKYGPIEKLIRDDSITSNTIARKRASAELLAYAEEVIDIAFETNESGLRDGYVINIQSDARGIDEDVLIKKVQFKAITPFKFIYKVSCISTQRYTLIDLLRKFLQPDPMPADEQEVSERLFVDNENVRIVDEASFIAPFLYEEAVATTDQSYKDAVAPDDVEWVYGYFAPSSVNDTKRMGKYGRGAKYA